MNVEREEWARAFLRQASSDLAVYDLLERQPQQEFPRCHSLHYLQMACEKVAKAYRTRETDAVLHGEGGLLRRHVGFEKFMRSFLLSPLVKSRYEGKDAQLRQVSKTTLTLAREIEKLAPSVDEEAAPDNAEYPWWAKDRVVAPCEHDFPRLSLLRGAGGRTLLKLVREAVRQF
ncbi:MAG TPA: hypothetical protein PKA88_25675 [Polyangiaceae bacterium]|nr:hypothetical protein [Polyangiaceae bacterium]HMR76570.1 hypothetical protein [Polyangiaceae bacterium]